MAKSNDPTRFLNPLLENRMKPMNAARFGHSQRGFALIVTLSLMILLTVIAVGLLTLSTISLRSSTREAAATAARANARMALMMAIGQLQVHAGPDQRVSATADIAGGVAGIAAADAAAPVNVNALDGQSKGLSPVLAGTRLWTGIWKNRDLPNLIYTKTPSPQLQQWLVSGNEATPFGITPGTSLYGLKSDGTVSDATKAVVMVGANSAGNQTNDPRNYVSAPLIDIYGAGTTPKKTGRYGWWVGDEGVKARINLDNTLTDGTYASLTAQRRGWETVDGLAAYPTSPGAPSTPIAKVTDLAQAALLVPTAAGVPLRSVFHSATADSRAVLADSLSGGTKVDLSAALSSALPNTSPVAALTNYPVKGKNIIVTPGATAMRAPRWDAVKDFRDRFSQLESGSLVVKAATADETAAIAPLITDFRILMGAKMKLKATTTASDTYNINACGKIAVAIANPYSVPLKWNKDIELEIRSQTPTGNNPSRIWNLGANTAFIPANTGEAAVFNNVVFRIKSSSLAPGEARAYTLAGPTFRTRALGTQRLVVDLAPFQTSSPFNFSNCVELENPTVTTVTGNTPSMDVRESWQTTLVMLETRLEGSSAILRRIERFELDNGYWSPNARVFTKAEALTITQPFPLMCYSFQLSQPGADYKSIMPSTYEMGQRGSTLRTFADFNLQAARVRRPIASYNPPPYFMECNDSRSLLPATAPGGDTGTSFTRNLALSPMPWGRSSSGSKETILFSVPSQLASIAQLQHADLTGDDFTASIAHQPGNAVGNSYATPFVKRGLTNQGRTDYELIGAPNNTGTNKTQTNYYDISYLLNASLWDSYFFSTIPASGTAIPVNPTLISLNTGTVAATQLRDPVNAASLLMVDGAFNVNSTDKNAWKAFLASAKQFKHKAGPASASEAAFPRSLEQTSPSADPPTGSASDSFSGYRRLTDAQLETLAGEIVKQVRLRGPFVSLSHFINRALADITVNPALTRSGALQQALDESGANIDFAGSKKAFSGITSATDAVTLAWKTYNGQSGPRSDMDGTDVSPFRPNSVDPNHIAFGPSSTDNNFNSVASIVADQELLKDATYKPEQGFRSTGIPGWVTQADVLQVIGSSLTARSDTFRIRAYGESLDASGTPVAKAYCEAIIQRLPTYTDPSNEPSARGTALSTTNQNYGRKFEIVSFRWLSPQEI
jgi:Tfp pilus assembly protein PilX